MTVAADRPINRFRSKLGDVRESNGQVKARCPAHNDKTASLSLSEGTDGQVLLKCHRGCLTEAIVSELGLEMKDLFQSSVPAKSEKQQSYNRAEVSNFRHVTALYDYVDAHGNEMLKIRKEEPGKRKTFLWLRRDGSQWRFGLNGLQKPLYHLAALGSAVSCGERVYVVEGEKDVHSAESLGLTATTSPDGASEDDSKPKWVERFNPSFKGADVVVIPDNDGPGRAHAEYTAKNLCGVSATVRILSLPGLKEKGDLTDWIDAGGTREKLEALVQTAPLWKPPAGSAPAAATATDDPHPLPGASAAMSAMPPDVEKRVSLARVPERIQSLLELADVHGSACVLDAALEPGTLADLAFQFEDQYGWQNYVVAPLRDFAKVTDKDRGKIEKEAKKKLKAILGRQRADSPPISRTVEMVTGADLPVIKANGRSLPDISGDGENALNNANKPNPRLFQRGGELARIHHTENGPAIQHLNESALRGELARVAHWMTENDKGEVTAAFPPVEVVRDILTRPSWNFPSLLGISRCPVIAPDGSLVTLPGYHPGTKLYFCPDSNLRIPVVPVSPTDSEIKRAREWLTEELLVNFPFSDKASLAHSICLQLQPIVRPMIDGPTPLHHIDAGSGPGTGKTLLAAVSTIPATGAPPDVMTEGRDEDEWRKRLTSTLIPGPVYILVDNIRRRLDSATLSATLTAYPAWKDRLLGTSQDVRIPVLCAWMSTGNNTTFSDEIARRVVYIRLNFPGEEPYNRPVSVFRHPNLMEWAKANRGDLLWALLTLGQAWVAEGRPDGKQTFASYESWARVMGGILEVAGVPGFMENHQQQMTLANEEVALWRAFVAAWRDRFGTGALVGPDQLFALATHDGLLGPVLGEGMESSQRTRLGKAISRKRDRVFSELRIEYVRDDRRGRKIYRLQRAEVPAQTPNLGAISARTSAGSQGLPESDSRNRAEVAEVLQPSHVGEKFSVCDAHDPHPTEDHVMRPHLYEEDGKTSATSARSRENGFQEQDEPAEVCAEMAPRFADVRETSANGRGVVILGEDEVCF